MSIAKLRQILSRNYRVSVDSSPVLANQVNLLARRGHNAKQAVEYAPLASVTEMHFTALDLLRKVGELTTPTTANFARLSSSWATRRYVWAMSGGAASGKPPSQRMRLSGDARRMERHQKTLLSDEFGIGFAGLLSERLLNAPRFVDVQFAIDQPGRYFGARASFAARPDYLMWGSATPVFVVECKGCQTSRNAVMQQLRRGLEQLPSISIPGRTSVQLVMGAFLGKTETTIFVLDPPDEPFEKVPTDDTSRETNDAPIRRVSDRRFEIADDARFDEKLTQGQVLSLLRWIGQHQTAAKFQRRFYDVSPVEELPNVALAKRRKDGKDFVVVGDRLAPELGIADVRILRGIRASVLEQLEAGQLPEMQFESSPASSSESLSSEGPLGTLLTVEGLN